METDMGGRARGANAKMALAFEPAYGAVPASGFYQMPNSGDDLGEEQGLIAADELGQGRDPMAPALDVIKDEGTINVPIDARYFALWLKLHFGAPTTTAGLPAIGSYTFSAQPGNNSKLTVNGTDLTFVSATPAAGQVKIGTTLADTLTSAVLALNASADANISPATYALDATGTKILIEHDTQGVGGNAFTIVAGSGSNATASGATLTGGAATGAYKHVFASGALTLPSASIEIGNPEVPAYMMNYGVVSDKIAITVQRSGLLKAVITYIAQGEAPTAAATAAGTPTSYAFQRLLQAVGSVSRSGVPLGELVSGNCTISNGYDKAENIREDGRIDGADPGPAAYSGQAIIRFKSTANRDQARSGLPIDLTYAWKLSLSARLYLTFHEVYLPRPKMSRNGPGGIQETYDWQAAKNATAGRACTVTVWNDVASYA
jgi:hypothetical protein